MGITVPSTAWSQASLHQALHSRAFAGLNRSFLLWALPSVWCRCCCWLCFSIYPSHPHLQVTILVWGLEWRKRGKRWPKQGVMQCKASSVHSPWPTHGYRRLLRGHPGIVGRCLGWFHILDVVLYLGCSEHGCAGTSESWLRTLLIYTQEWYSWNV